MVSPRGALTLLPVLTGAAGYLVGGAEAAVSGFVIPVGPLLCVWLFADEEAPTTDPRRFGARAEGRSPG
jgi:hypothetical protein